MPTHGLPDGRIPVLLSSHDPELIRRDAAAILSISTASANRPKRRVR